VVTLLTSKTWPMPTTRLHTRGEEVPMRKLGPALIAILLPFFLVVAQPGCAPRYVSANDFSGSGLVDLRS
jgi:hypothetical protein